MEDLEEDLKSHHTGIQNTEAMIDICVLSQLADLGRPVKWIKEKELV
ncbi:MAG: hypothetical protein AAFO01_16530 [Pseudomonadota bacterium]